MAKKTERIDMPGQTKYMYALTMEIRIIKSRYINMFLFHQDISTCASTFVGFQGSTILSTG